MTETMNLDLFPPATRNTDPRTSMDAERQHEESGRRKSRVSRCVSWVNQHPGYTAGEIAEQLKIERSEISKRLADARNMNLLVNGEPRKCRVKGSSMMTWYPR